MEMLFDQFSRYEIVARSLRRVAQAHRTGSATEPFSILDVGSGVECLLERFIPEARITYLDPLLELRADQTHIATDIFHAELPDGSFDYVVAIDTLEQLRAFRAVPAA